MHDYLIQNEENPNVKREKNIEELNLLLDKNQEIYDRDFYYIYKKIINNKLDANLNYFENKLELKAKVCETYPSSLHKGILLEICNKDTL